MTLLFFVDHFNNNPFSVETITSTVTQTMVTKAILLESNNTTGDNTWLDTRDHKSTLLATTFQQETIHDWKQ